MVYTCAYFPAPTATLEEAQRAKMDLVCRKLWLQPGETVVEAGCGWGALALHMARHYGVTRQGLQHLARADPLRPARAKAEGLDGRVEFIEDDYRNIAGRFDAFVSVGMLEHVGARPLPRVGPGDRPLLDARPAAALIHAIGRDHAGRHQRLDRAADLSRRLSAQPARDARRAGAPGIFACWTWRTCGCTTPRRCGIGWHRFEAAADTRGRACSTSGSSAPGGCTWPARWPPSPPARCNCSKSSSPATRVNEIPWTRQRYVGSAVDGHATADVLIVGGGPAGSTCAGKLRAAGSTCSSLDKAAVPPPEALRRLDHARRARRTAPRSAATTRRGRVLQPMTGFRVGRIGGRSLRSSYPAGRSASASAAVEFDDYLLRRSAARLRHRRSRSKRSAATTGSGSSTSGSERRCWWRPADISAPSPDCSAGAQPAPRAGVACAGDRVRADSGQQAACPIEPDGARNLFLRRPAGLRLVHSQGELPERRTGRGRPPRTARPCGRVSASSSAARDGFPGRCPASSTAMPICFTSTHAGRWWTTGVLWIGDAAGLAYPQSGEGIRPAIESGLDGGRGDSGGPGRLSPRVAGAVPAAAGGPVRSPPGPARRPTQRPRRFAAGSPGGCWAAAGSFAASCSTAGSCTPASRRCPPTGESRIPPSRRSGYNGIGLHVDCLSEGSCPPRKAPALRAGDSGGL